MTSKNYKKTLTVNGTDYTYFDIQSAIANIETLPYSLRILTEGILRNFDGVKFTSEHLEKLQNYDGKTLDSGEIPFKPSMLSCKTLLVYQQLLTLLLCVIQSKN